METLERLRSELSDRYTVMREVGSGGKATVFLAQDLKHHRKVAIKVLNPGLSDALSSERFLRDLEVTATLTHPSILPIFDSGEAGGLLYYVMPFVEGDSLRDRLGSESQLPVKEAVRIARGIASALAFAHEKGILHRDVKPGDILFEGEFVVLADLGVAQAAARAHEDAQAWKGIPKGIPTYKSPEQAGGEGDLDGRCDQYALACVLYEMLGGRPPFPGAEAETVMEEHRTVDPVPIDQVRSSVPGKVAWVLGRALSKSPADRFRTMEEFSGNLDVPLFLADRLPALFSRPVVTAVALGAAGIIVLAAVLTLLKSCG